MPSIELRKDAGIARPVREFLRWSAGIFATDRRQVAAGVAAALAIGAIVSACRQAEPPVPVEQAAPAGPTGTITGQVHLMGKPPAPDRIRMNADPMCAKANDGRDVVQADVVVGADDALANVFVQLKGDFPATPAPTDPVEIDQHGCLYVPRVAGVRVGQPLVVRNSDMGLHNVHGSSARSDLFNVSQPVAGMTNTFRPMEEGILTLKCDVHTWMVAHVGVVNHPYFAVTGADGAFTLHHVPAGTYTLQIWHERFGTQTAQVTVPPDGTATVDLKYASST
jgi:hypothetical protein